MSAVWEPTRSSGAKPATSKDTSTSDTKPIAEYTRLYGYIYVKLPGMTDAAQVAMDPDTGKPVVLDKKLRKAYKEVLAVWDTLEK
ncbi:hypothetical protein BG015_006343, partial [Linnemannia schmuckeri]